MPDAQSSPFSNVHCSGASSETIHPAHIQTIEGPPLVKPDDDLNQIACTPSSTVRTLVPTASPTSKLPKRVPATAPVRTETPKNATKAKRWCNVALVFLNTFVADLFSPCTQGSVTVSLMVDLGCNRR